MQTASLDPYVAKAVQIVNNLNLDENARSLAEKEDLKLLDLVDQLEYAKETGKEEGMQASHGEVWEAATKAATKTVTKTVTNNTLIDVAKNMLKINIPIDQIVFTTKLPKEEIYKLAK